MPIDGSPERPRNQFAPTLHGARGFRSADRSRTDAAKRPPIYDRCDAPESSQSAEERFAQLSLGESTSHEGAFPSTAAVVRAERDAGFGYHPDLREAVNQSAFMMGRLVGCQAREAKERRADLDARHFALETRFGHLDARAAKLDDVVRGLAARPVRDTQLHARISDLESRLTKVATSTDAEITRTSDALRKSTASILDAVDVKRNEDKAELQLSLQARDEAEYEDFIKAIDPILARLQSLEDENVTLRTDNAELRGRNEDLLSRHGSLVERVEGQFGMIGELQDALELTLARVDRLQRTVFSMTEADARRTR